MALQMMDQHLAALPYEVANALAISVIPGCPLCRKTATDFRVNLKVLLEGARRVSAAVKKDVYNAQFTGAETERTR